jgi:Na+-driven multidrug efflux pump
VPLIINEIAPVGLNGIGGVINHIFLVIGTACTSIFALYIESDPNAQISPIWRLIYGFPIISLVIQLLLLLFVFKEETPRYLLENGNTKVNIDRQF